MSRLNTAQKTILFTLAATAGVAHATPEACEQDFVMNDYLEESDDFGNDDFGGSYRVGAGLFELSTLVLAHPCRMWESYDARYDDNDPRKAQILESWETIIESLTNMIEGDGDSLRAAADADTTIFGYTQSVAKLSAVVSDVEASIYIEAMGQTIVDVDAMNAPINYMRFQTLYGKSADIDLGIVSVSVGAELMGVFGVQGMATLRRSKVSAQITPLAALNVTAEASVDLYVASAGVSGSLDLLRFEVPSEMSIDANGWTLDADAEATAIDGSLEVFASALGQSASVTICEFDGFTLFDETLISDSGTF